MTKNKDILDNEVSFLELWHVIKTYKIALLLLPLIVTFVAWVTTLSMNPTWEATALIEVAQTGKVVPLEGSNNESNEQKITWLDSPETLISRITHPSFIHETINASPLMEKLAGESFSNNAIVANRVKNTPLIKLEVKTSSQESSRLLTLAIATELQSIQKDRLDYAIGFLKERIKQNNEAIKEMNNDLRAISTNEQNKPSTDFYIKNILKEKRILSSMNIFLNEQLGTANTHPSRILGQIHISNSNTYVKQAIIVAMAFLISTFLTIAAAFVHYAVTNKKELS